MSLAKRNYCFVFCIGFGVFCIFADVLTAQKIVKTHELTGTWREVQKGSSTSQPRYLSFCRGTGTFKPYREWFAFDFDETRFPKAIDTYDYGAPEGNLTLFGVKKMRGIYRITGDKLELQQNVENSAKPGGSIRPTRFKNPAVYTRVKEVTIILNGISGNQSVVVLHNGSKKTENLKISFKPKNGTRIKSGQPKSYQLTLKPGQAKEFKWKVTTTTTKKSFGVFEVY